MSTPTVATTTTATTARPARRSAGSTRAPRPAAPEGPAGRRPRPAVDRQAARQPAAGRGERLPLGEGQGPRALLRAFAHLFLEVESGRRPARQLASLMEPVLHARLESCWVRLGQPLGQVRSVHAWPCGRDHVDAVVVVQRGHRAGALALRLGRHRGRWHVTFAARPEDGPLPPAPFSMPPENPLDDCDLPAQLDGLACAAALG